MAYAIPTHEERPILFRWLKQQSSYTIWSQTGPYFEAWIDEVKRVFPLAIESKTGNSILAGSDFRLALVCWAAFVDALACLKTGDKSVFRWLGYGTGRGYFCEAGRLIEVWQSKQWRDHLGDPPFAIMETPFWPELGRRFDALVDVWSNGGAALELRHTDVPAFVEDMRDLRGEFGPGYPSYRSVRDAQLSLPPVPAPAEEIIVKTGESIPCYGIWEPVKLDLSPGFVGMFKKPVLPDDGKFELDGCMNYLHAGSPAPTIAFEEDDNRREGRPTVWRLLWRDDRYTDGSIPAEESEYVFVGPDDSTPAELEPRTAEDADLLAAQSGQQAPQAGVWAARDYLNVQARVAQFEPLPRHEGRDVTWVLVSTI